MPTYKKLNFDIFQLETFDNNQQPINFESLLRNPQKGLSPLPKDSGSVLITGKIEEMGRYFTGTVSHRQMSNLPSSLDDIGNFANLPLSAKQGLAFSNSFLFDPELQFLIYESNRSGATLKLFCDLFQYNYQLHAIDTGFVLDPVERQRFNNMTVFKKLKVKAARVANGSIFNAKRKSVKQVMQAADDTNADTLECTLSADKYSSLSVAKIRDMVKNLMTYKQTEEVETLLLTGKEDEGGKTQIIDFVGGKIRLSFSVETTRNASEFGLKQKYEKMAAEYGKIRQGLLKAYKLKPL